MKTTMQALATVLLLAGCSSEVSGPSQPASCDKAKAVGTYFFDFTALNGDCGEQTDALIKVDPNAAGTGECQVRSRTYSENDCKLEVTQTCRVSDPTVYGGWTTMEATSVMRQTAADGSTLAGTMSITIKDRCAGTYDIKATRR